MLINVFFNIIIPVAVLLLLSDNEYIDPTFSLLLSLVFPLLYAVYSMYRQRRLETTSLIGIISVLITASVGVFRLDPQIIAIKEAAPSTIIGIVIIILINARYPWLEKGVEKIIDIKKVSQALEKAHNFEKYKRRVRRASYIMACAFFLSAVLNYGIARVIIVSPPDTAEFNRELARMNALEFPLITIPTFLIMLLSFVYLVLGIKKLTDLDYKDIVGRGTRR